MATKQHQPAYILALLMHRLRNPVAELAKV